MRFNPPEASRSQSFAFSSECVKSPVIESKLQETRGDFSIPAVISVRPTGYRLVVAMGLASILLATLLKLDVNLKTGVKTFSAQQDVLLTVHITKRRSEETPYLTTDEQALHTSIREEQLLNESSPSEISKSDVEEIPGSSADSPVDSERARDWYALIEHSSKASVGEYFSREDVRASMWKQTQSIMFRPENDLSMAEEEPLLANISFRQPVGVLGLGFTVGSCFIGIPIAGVPVEERKIAITLFVCRDDSG